MKVNLPQTEHPRVVIIGGGYGGITLAKTLRNKPVQVVMLDKHNYHTFQPLLYQVATGGLEPDSIAFPLRKMFKGIRNFHFRMAEVQSLDLITKSVSTSIGNVEYDYLVIATGSRTNFFGNKELMANSLSMKTIPEALDLRSLILQNFEEALLSTALEEREGLMNFVVVGAGPTGVETAGALAELKNHILPKDYPELDLSRMQIHLIEAGPAMLPGMSEKASENGLRDLEKLGVKVSLNTRVESYNGTVVETNADKNISARTVIWSAGVVGNPVFGLEKEALSRNNRIEVDVYNKVKGCEHVYAIGDVALMRNEAYPEGHPMVAPPAIQQGELLGLNILNQLNDRPLKPFKYFDKGSMATIGRNRAVVDWKNIHVKGVLAWLMWMAVHLMYLAGFRNKLVVFTNWFWSYLTYDKGNRLIIRPFNRNLLKAPDTVKDRRERVGDESG